MKQRLEQKQLQKLILTQTLKQSIELLQYSQQELEEKLEEIAKENPFLVIKKKNYIPTWFINLYYDKDAAIKKQKAIENVATTNTSLYSVLREQLKYLKLTEQEKEAADILISSLDKNGFLLQDPEYLLKPFSLSFEQILNLRKKLASLDPIGCCALNYIESLIFQLEIQYPDLEESKNAIYLLKECIQELENQDWKTLEKKSGLTKEKIQKAISLMRTLNPFPGKDYVSENTVYIEPDVYVLIDQTKEDPFIIFLNDKIIKNIEFNKEYIDQIQQKNEISTAEMRKLKNKYYTAQFLIRSIEQRNQTLIEVTKSIVNFQKDFFLYKKEIQPLRLKDIAEEVQLHISTVSRITSRKYVYTKWGIYELKYFFKRGFKNSHNRKIAPEKIKELIKEIISKEDKKNPLRDKEISEILLYKGIKIARRTIAKYRKELSIPSVSGRYSS
ncbi:MAG: RNA polymerase factor sigma-54 [Leptonema sp. (in: bacteria)]